MRYKVKDLSEEFACPVCGAPVYIGETAYQDGEGGDCYCSLYCCIKLGQRELAEGKANQA